MGWESGWTPSNPPEETGSGWDTFEAIPANPNPGLGWLVLKDIFLGLQAQGCLAFGAQARKPVALNLGAAGQLSPNAYARIGSVMNLSGQGELVINSFARKQADMAMVASGLLEMEVWERRETLMDLVANGVLSFGVSQALQEYLDLMANGQLTINAFARMSLVLDLIGAGALDLGGFARKTAGKFFSDNFNRADDLSQITNGWVARYGTMGIYANGVVPVAANQWNESTAPVLMDSNDMEVSFTLGQEFGAGFDYTTILLGCNESGEGAFIFFNGAAGVTIYTQTGWGAAGLVAQASIGASQVTGDRWTARRVGNTYTILKNGLPIGLSWPDATNIVPRDVNHRLVGIAAYTDGTNARTIEDFNAVDFRLFSAAGTLSIGALKRHTSNISMAATALLSISAGFPVNSPAPAQYAAAGAYTYPIPYWCRYIDRILLGGGGGGMGFGLAGAWTDGGKAGIWNTTTLERGVHIPWSTAQITGSVGAGGPGGSGNGTAGGATTANATGMTAASAAGGAGSNTRTTAVAGLSPGNQVVQGVTYTGGAAQGSATAAGNPPGGGGAGTTVSFTNGGAGARGQAWFRAWQ